MTETNLKATILLVEDDEAFRYAATRHLHRNGYAVIGVPSSVEALRAIDGGDIDVVVADVALYPREPHGIALARMILTKYPKMPILFVTAVMDIEQIESGIPGEILYKPVELADLARKLGELLA
jgi:CheY-like chemotaxis protein